MRYLLVSLTLATVTTLPGEFAFALAPRQVSLDQLSGLKVYVWPGQGLTLNFLPAHLVVKFVSLGHPGRFTISSDGSLCPLSTGETERTCPNTGANVLFTRVIGPAPLEFPGLQANADGSTQLSLEVQTPDGEKKVVPIELFPGKGQPKYGEIDVIADSPTPAPASTSKPSPFPALLPPRAIRQFVVPLTSTPNHLTSKTVLVPPTVPPKVKPPQLQPQTALLSNSASSLTVSSANQEQIAANQLASLIDDANAAAFGLVIANQKGQIKPYTTVWNQAENAITWLRRGQSQEDAAQKAGLNLSVLHQLIVWGQNRP